MGTKYSTTTVTGYNSSAPPDNGSTGADNQITWAKIKTKLPDPLKTALEAIDANLVTAFDVGPISKSAGYPTVAADHEKTISCTAAITVTLLDAATATAGYTVNISNQSTGNVTVGRATGTDTINGTAADVTIARGNSMTLRTNISANGYEVIETGMHDIAGLAKTDGNVIVGDGTNWVAESGATARTSLGLGTAATANTGTSGNVVPYLDDAVSFSGTSFSLVRTDAGAGAGPALSLFRDSASPDVNDTVGQVSMLAKNASAATYIYAAINSHLLNVTAGSEAADLTFFTSVAGVLGSRVIVGAGLFTPGATGGDKGINTLNASAVYDDNVLLTCYAIEAYKKGAVDVAYWDSVTPNLDVPAVPKRTEERPVTRKGMRTQRVRDGARIVERMVEVEEPVYDELPVFDEAGQPIKDADGKPVTARVPRTERVVTAPAKPARTEVKTHGPAARFAPRAAMMLDPKAYGASWKATGHLPAMPSPAEWDAADKKMSLGDIQQRLWETVECQAIHIDKLLGMIEALDARITALGG